MTAMYAAERQAAIVAATQREGRVGVRELSDRLGVGADTVRRDLALLERRGLLVRRRGAAEPTALHAPFEPTLEQRRAVDRRERRAIARRVLDLLPRGGVVVLDSGSLTLEVATLLRDRALTVVTNSLPAAAVLAADPALTVLPLPGRVRAVTHGTVGAWAHARLADVRADVAVLGANGVRDRAAFTTSPDEAAVKRGMLEAAQHRVLAVTAGKFARGSLVRFAPIDAFDTVVTDDRVDAEAARAVRASGARLEIVAPTH